jgi:predicted O-methyltransferase YrrM
VAQLTDRLDLARAAAAEHYPVSIPIVELERLRGWVVAEQARSTIEIGLAYGVSALAICDGLAEVGTGTTHVVIDPFQATSRFDSAGLRLLDEAGVADMVEFHPEPSELVLPRLLAEGRQFDLAFVDGNHRFDWVFIDLALLGRLVRMGGVIFVDDYQLPGVAKAIGFFVANRGWRIEQDSLPPANDPDHGWVVVRTPNPAVESRFTDFVDF